MKRTLLLLIAFSLSLVAVQPFHPSSFILHPSWGQPAPADTLPKLEPNLPGPFHPFNINGKNKGQFHCVVTKHGLNPMVLIFVRGSDPEKPLVDLLKKVDEAVNKHDKRFLGGCAVFLNSDILNDEQRKSTDTQLEDLLKDDDRREELSKKLFDALDTKEGIHRVILCLYSESGPKGYDIGKDAEVTVLLYRRYKILDQYSFAKGKMTDKDVDTIMQAIVGKLLPANK